MNSDEEWDIDFEGNRSMETDQHDEEHQADEQQDDDDQDYEQEDEEHEDEEREEPEISESEPEELDETEHDPDFIETCEVTSDHFDFIKRLGTGAYGTVFLVKKNCGIDTGKLYALKVIAKDVVVPVKKTIKHMKAERKVLELLRGCPYIPKLHYAFQTAEKLFIVLDYVPGGEMFTLLQKSVLDEHRVRFYIAELVIALEHIHKLGIVYRDIKLENILIDADGHIKLVDFGLCKKLGERGRTKSFCGTVEYMPPEVVNGTGHDTAADWWALGVLTIELLTGVTAFGSNEPGPNDIMTRIVNNEPIMPQNITAEMEDFIRKMLIKDPTMRLGGSAELADDIKNHPVFSEIDWKKLEQKQLPAPDIPIITHPFDVQNFSEDFTSQDAKFDVSGVPENSFLTFRGYSYIAPGLDNNCPDELKKENEIQLSIAYDVFNNRQEDSKFFMRYSFTSPNPIGTGTSSVCMKCMDLVNNNFYAVKIYHREHNVDDQIEALERCRAKKIKGVVQLIEVIKDDKWKYLVMELIDGVNLIEHLKTTSLNGKIIFDTFNALWKIVKKMHSIKYCHGRVCFKNIQCIKNSSEVYLIGFSYAEPIAFNGRIDYWSIGVCLYTLLCGHSPFTMVQSSETEILKNVDNNAFNKDSDDWNRLNENTKAVIDKLFQDSSSTLNPRNMKSFATETFPFSINSLEHLTGENENIVSIRAKALRSRMKSGSLDRNESYPNGNNVMENDVSSTEQSVTLSSQELDSVEPQSEDVDEMEKKVPVQTETSYKRRIRQREHLNNIVSQVDEPPLKLKKSNNESKRHKKPIKTSESVINEKIAQKTLENEENSPALRPRGRPKGMKNKGHPLVSLKVEKDDNLVNGSVAMSKSSRNSNLPSLQTVATKVKNEIGGRKVKTNKEIPLPVIIAETIRRSGRKQNSKPAELNDRQSIKKEPTSKLPSTGLTSFTVTEGNVQYSHYIFPKRKREQSYYVFERYDYN